MPIFTIGNPKYLEGIEDPCGLDGFNPPPLGSDGYLTKIMSTSLGISICMLTWFVPLGVYGLKPVIVWAGVVVNGISITVTIEWGITTKYKIQILLVSPWN